MQQARPRQSAVFWMVFSGLCTVLLWADCLNVGRNYDTGQIMSATLVAGPLVGIVGMLSGTAISLALGKWMAGRSAAIRFAQLLAWNIKVMLPWAVVGALLWLPHFLLDQPVFLPGGPGLWIWLMLTLPLLALWAYHTTLGLQLAFGWSLLRSGMVFGTAVLLTQGLLLFIFSIVIGIRLF